MRKQKGFSLIELLIVVAIILIIAAIAIPSLLRSRMLANQSAAASTVRTLVTAQSTYFSTYGAQVGYAGAIALLGPPGGGVSCPPPPYVPLSTGACLIDGVLALGNKGGYNYSVLSGGAVPPLGPVNFTISATPQAPGSTGIHDYCSIEDGLIMVRTPPVGLVPLGPCAPAPPFQVLQN
jgi:type IV pilus assembly protein PilA